MEGEHAISRRVQSSDGRIRKRNGSRHVHSLKLLRVVMDVFDAIRESCFDPKLREQRGDQAAEVSIEMSQGGDRTMGSDNARNITNSNSLFDAKVLFFETMVKLGTSGSSTWMQPRTSMTSRTTGDHHWVGTRMEMAIELLSEKQVRSDFKIGELHGKIMHGWEKERTDAPILESGAESQVIVYCREREGCRFVREDDFIFGEELMLEVETNNEKMILMKNTDDDNRTVTVLSRLAMCKSEIRVDSRQILLAKMELDGASTKSVANTAANSQEKHKRDSNVQEGNNES